LFLFLFCLGRLLETGVSDGTCVVLIHPRYLRKSRRRYLEHRKLL
jgi:hypothetical protein